MFKKYDACCCAEESVDGDFVEVADFERATKLLERALPALTYAANRGPDTEGATIVLEEIETFLAEVNAK